MPVDGQVTDTHATPSSSHLAVLNVSCVAYDLGLPSSVLAEGTYAWFSGPTVTYETCGEGDAAGFWWSNYRGIGTVPETGVAVRDDGVGVLGFSLPVVTGHHSPIRSLESGTRLCAVGA
jgi:hypothetical protein